MKVGTKDKSTIKAVDEISSKYPFAAALLAYAIVERVLKEYITKNRNNRSLLDYSYRKRVLGKDICLQKYYRFIKAEFVKGFIGRLTLGDAQRIVKLNGARDYAAARNNLMHSNSFLLEERKYSKAKRHTINEQSYKQARRDLDFVISKFSDLRHPQAATISNRNSILNIAGTNSPRGTLSCRLATRSMSLPSTLIARR